MPKMIRNMTPLAAGLSVLLGSAAWAQDEHRELGAHEHGVSTLDIAIEGSDIALMLHAPGADIVGFEYEAESDEDVAAVEAALQTLSDPLALFDFGADAGCTVSAAEAEVVHGDHDEHDHEHAEEDDHDEHEDSEDEDHDDHDEHADHDEHDEDHDHDHEGGHSEFEAVYSITCTGPVTEMTFPYLDAFPNAQEIEVQLITETGASAAEITRDASQLALN
ncbi:zinc uptake protein ZrgA [Pseudoroseicyclus sp. H15]